MSNVRIKTTFWRDSSFNTVFFLQTEKDANCLEPWLIKEMDSCLSDIWLHKDIDSFAQVFHLILTENVSGKILILLLKKKQPQNGLNFCGYFISNFKSYYLWMLMPIEKMNRVTRINKFCSYSLFVTCFEVLTDSIRF